MQLLRGVDGLGQRCAALAQGGGYGGRLGHVQAHLRELPRAGKDLVRRAVHGYTALVEDDEPVGYPRRVVHAVGDEEDGGARLAPVVEDVFEYDLDTPPAELDHFCAQADFVFNLAGVNRPKNNDEFMQGNFGFASTLLDTLKSHANRCPVMLSSSIQATLIGRYGESDYGKSKLAGEELFFTYGQETGAPVLVYRFPNLFGKWCRPNYNSAVATFCNNTANALPITVNYSATELELL